MTFWAAVSAAVLLACPLVVFWALTKAGTR